MNSDELMINDWVDAGYYEQINGIDDRSGLIRLIGNIGWYKAREYSPIPISGEILKANGFVEIGSLGIYSQGFENDKYIFNFYIEYNMDNFCLWLNEGLLPVPVKYVHELQHAMRLCGLNDEADDFMMPVDSAKLSKAEQRTLRP